MLDSLMLTATAIINFLAQKYCVVGETIGVLIFVVAPLVSMLIEVVEIIAALTPSTSDDEAAKRMRAKYDGVIKALEFLPHVNLPVAPVLLHVLAVAKKVLGALRGAISGYKAN